MLQVRVIPVLLLRNKGLVKTVKFNKAKYIGDPINAVRIFNEKEVDELVFLDIMASKLNKKPDFELIKDIASECFMPLAYGGGVTEIEDVQRLFAIGIEKVIFNTSALNNLNLITEAAEIFGDQSIVASIDVVKKIWGKYQVYSHAKVKTSTTNPVKFAVELEKRGAGEIVINSVDRDGTMQGYDTELISKISQEINIPLVACGGAGKLSDLPKAIEAGASAIAAGSLFVYHGPHKAVLINYPTQQQIRELFPE